MKFVGIKKWILKYKISISKILENYLKVIFGGKTLYGWVYKTDKKRFRV